eukprot:TRINITY_DN916_c1_g1_i1.p1 TRINITY_DN916_c1_g1~~TRINITY_DN916_c1_g1_i1.p1  ORF type:complete len:480 (+),score=160.43 TRINITY_DN916_c1_g1_i1:66-1505(+)
MLQRAAASFLCRRSQLLSSRFQIRWVSSDANKSQSERNTTTPFPPSSTATTATKQSIPPNAIPLRPETLFSSPPPRSPPPPPSPSRSSSASAQTIFPSSSATQPPLSSSSSSSSSSSTSSTSSSSTSASSSPSSLSPALSEIRDQLTSSLQFCANTVQTKDFEGFLTTMLMPKNVRAINVALRALNLELLDILNSARTPQARHLRYLWWKDAIHSTFAGSPPEHPVLTALSFLLSQHKLNEHYVMRLLDARVYQPSTSNASAIFRRSPISAMSSSPSSPSPSSPLSSSTPSPSLSSPSISSAVSILHTPFNSIKDVAEFAEFTTSSLLYLSLETINIRDEGSRHVAAHIGTAIALTTLIRGVPFLAASGTIQLPRELLSKHKVDIQSVKKGFNSEALQNCLFEIASEAKAHLYHARQLRATLPAQAMIAFLPAVTCDRFLERLRRANFNVFHAPLHNPTPWEMLKLRLSLWWHALWKKF